ncbi:MAG: hypothetical protein OXI01_06785 [Albidovulum sp.]|nr:hypothetical protein [Albidovulum sp.]
MTFRDKLGPEKPDEPEFEFAERGKKKRGKKNFEGAADESGLRFGPDVPVETIPLANPEAEAQTPLLLQDHSLRAPDLEAPRHWQARRRRFAARGP